MGLNDLPGGATVYIDANIFIYHFTGHSEESSVLLQRCESGDLNAFTGTIVLFEVMHRLMILEAMQHKLVRSGNPAGQLSENPDIVRRLSEYQIQTQKIAEMGVTVLELPQNAIMKSYEFRQRYGLLTNDSLIVLDTRNRGIPNIASNDGSFDRVTSLHRFAPTDVGQTT